MLFSTLLSIPLLAIAAGAVAVPTSCKSDLAPFCAVGGSATTAANLDSVNAIIKRLSTMKTCSTKPDSTCTDILTSGNAKLQICSFGAQDVDCKIVAARVAEIASCCSLGNSDQTLVQGRYEDYPTGVMIWIGNKATCAKCDEDLV